MGKSNIQDVKQGSFWRACIGELLGTLFLVLVGCGSCLDANSSTVQKALGFGLSVATMAWILSNVSGCHINPAITLPMVVTRKVTIVRGLFYIIAQIAGGVIGAAILKGLIPSQYHGALGATGLSPKVTVAQGFGIEFMITFVLVFTVFASCDGKRNDFNGSTPLSIGLSITMCHVFAVPFTGASMNPARSFGPAAVMKSFPNHWVYWVGPLLGGLVAGLLYDFIFAANASVEKLKACFTERDYDNDKFPKDGVTALNGSPSELKKIETE
ncbi:unnamed protein product [Owenia fusiformis]|uniref:Uncharacterized protein n=1 Tax=Owenia fusiformis TaxID=6347 RepID=A0A8J1UPA8_OWEFU|nr:unnamed protein product [Owenia fusiformis]